MNLRTVSLLVGLSLGLVALDFTIPNAAAQTNSWIGSSFGFWQDLTGWSLKLAPNSSQSALITNAGNKTVLIDSSTASGYSNTLTVSDLILTGQGGAENMLLVDSLGSSAPLHILNSLIVNPGGTLLSLDSMLLVDNAAGGAVDIEGTAALSGTNFLSGGLYVGFPTNSAASVSIIDGQTTFTNGYVTIGFYGSAQITLSGGTLQTEDNVSVPNGMFIGFGPGSQGTLSIIGATALVPEHLSLGEDAGSTGQLWINGGQLIATNNYLVTIGGNRNDLGQVGVPSGPTNVYNYTFVGTSVGQLDVSNGQFAASYLIVGDSLGSAGTLTLADSTMNLSGAMVVAQGQSSTGSVFISSSQLSVTNQGGSVNGFGTAQLSLTIGGFGVGQLTLSNSSLLAQNVIVGDCENSKGTFTITGSTVSIASNLIAGARAYIGTATGTNANANGTIQMLDGILTVTNQYGTGLLAIGQQGNGSLFQNGGVVQVDQFAIAAATSGSLTVYGAGRFTNVFYSAVGGAVLSNGAFLTQSVTIGGGTNCHGLLSVAGGTISVFSNVLVAVSSNASSTVQVSGGYLSVTNPAGNAQLLVGLGGPGTFAQSGGVVTVDQLLVGNPQYWIINNFVTNYVYSTFGLVSGVFNARSATVSNFFTCVVGDGVDSATYHLLGGVHTFFRGLEITNGAVLSGCGTINGSVLVDEGGTVIADCGGTLTFTGVVTNNGTWTALNGSTFESYGPMVNNGVINVLDGHTNFVGGFVNNGIVLDQDSIPQIVSVTAIGSNVQIEFSTAPKLLYILEYTSDLVTPNWTPLIGIIGPGGNVSLADFGATQQTQRFYRVHMMLPP